MVTKYSPEQLSKRVFLWVKIINRICKEKHYLNNEKQFWFSVLIVNKMYVLCPEEETDCPENLTIVIASVNCHFKCCIYSEY